MHKVVFTKSLDKADDIEVKVIERESLQDAVIVFNELVNSVLQHAFSNEFISCKMSMHKHKALVKVEDIHYCIAIAGNNYE